MSLLALAVDCKTFSMAGPADCIACSRAMPTDGKFLTCSECKHSYHLGQQCAGVGDSTFIAMGAVKREKWRCRTCRTCENRSGSVSGLSQDPDSSVAAHLTSIERKLESLLSLKQSVDSLLALPAKVDQLLELRPRVESLGETIKEVQSAIDFLSTKYDTLLAAVTDNEKSVRVLQAESQTLKATVAEQSSVIERLQCEVNDAEQYSRASNLEIHGLPFNRTENLSASVRDLATKLSLPIPQPGDVLAVHRLPGKSGAVPPVLIRFASAPLRDRWLAARSKLSTLRETASTARLFFNENLTRGNKELFWKARSRGKDKNYRYIWVKRGKIYAKKADGAPLVKIACTRDLDKIV